MANRIPSHSLSDIANEAAKIPVTDEVYGLLPHIPDALLLPLIRIAHTVPEDTPENDSNEEPSRVPNERFYVDETNMVEKKFLRDATEIFETARDTDPFADADLRETAWECLLSHPVVEPLLREWTKENVLSGGNDRTRLMDMATFLRNYSEFEAGRIRFRKERGVTMYDQSAMAAIVDQGTDELERVSALAYIIGEPVVVEEENGVVRTYGPSPSSPDQIVYWLRCVVDGCLGISLKASDAEERFSTLLQKAEKPLRYAPDENGSPLLRHKKIRVTHLREIYQNVTGEKPKGLKKGDLVRNLSEKCLWAPRWPSLYCLIN